MARIGHTPQRRPATTPASAGSAPTPLRVVKRVVAAAAIGLLLAGCGGHAAPKPPTAADTAAAHWRAGLARWGRSMNAAVDNLSVIFSRADDVRGIQAGDKIVDAKLTAIERTLDGCAARVTALGDAPAALLQARTVALIACTQLEKGATLVREGVQQLQSGLGPVLFDNASAPLGGGQDDVRRAILDLAPATG